MTSDPKVPPTVPVLLRDRFLFESRSTKPVPVRTGTGIGIKLINVAIPLPLNDPFTYSIPEHLREKVQVGTRVKVPFKNRTITGFIVAVDPETHIEKPKDALEILDSEPVLSDHMIRLAKWISEYYFSSLGEAISNMLPKFAMRKNEKKADEMPADKLIVSNLELNEEQKQAFTVLKERLIENKFSEVFLFGVTGGGKSELYIRSIKEALSQGKSAICLVPEIALTEQIKLFFESHFHDQLEVLHSKFTDRERALAWHRIERGERKVILGARSAIFAPLKNLGLIIMDEEQETSYKQDQSPRYHAREVARWRAKDLNAIFLMGTATPSLETMYRISSGEVEILKLTKRIDDKPLPEVQVIDMKEASEIAKRYLIISPRLQKAIDQELNRKKGILLMLNRRGFSTHIKCFDCGEAVNCPYCAVTLTFHQEQSQALCHYCNYRIEEPDRCKKCKSKLLKFTGIGTEKVESEVARLFPAARIARLDTDSTRKKGSHEAILRQFRNQEIDILVGTQMIAKGFDFQHVTLVGIVSADTGLLLPDFRSAEKTFQLLVQMAGRSGRGKELGKVLIQTYSANHYAIRYASKHEYTGFYNEEIERRKALNYPPVTKLVNVIFRGKIEKAVQEQVSQLRKLLEDDLLDQSVTVMGPAPLPLYRLRGHFRWHLMLKAKEIEPIQRRIQKAFSQFKRKAGVFYAIDADPVTIL